MKRLKLNNDLIIWGLFTLIAIIIFGNLNGILFGLLGTESILSPLILALSLLLIYFLLVESPVGDYLYMPFLLFMVFLSGHFIIGLVVKLLIYDVHSGDSFSKIYDSIRKLIPTFIIFFSSYLYFIYQFRRGKILHTIETLSWLTFLSVLSIVFSTMLGIQSTIFENMTIGESTRAAGFFANPNGAGIASNLSLSFALGLMFLKKKRFIIYSIIAGVSFYASIITFSKAAIITACMIIIFCILFLLFRFRKLLSFQRRKFLILFIIVFSSIAYISTLVGPYLESLDHQQLKRIEYTLDLLSGEINKNTTSHRAEAWTIGFELIKERPLFGHGLDSFHRLKEINIGVHNTLLMIWGESGIFTLLLFLIFLIVLSIAAFGFNNKAYTLLVLSLLLVFVVQDVLTGHNALENRITNITLTLCTVLVTFRHKL